MKRPYSIATLLIAAALAMPGRASAQDATTKACLGDPSPDNRLAACAKVLALHPNDPNFSWALNIRGIAYYQKNDTADAIKEYGAAIKLNPKDPQAYNNRGTVYHRQGRHEKAIADYTDAIRLPFRDWYEMVNPQVVTVSDPEG